jgi:HD-like signal output (HDOD) protein
MSIENLFQRPNALPAIPGLVQELIASFNDEHASVEGISKKIAADPVLSAKLLRLANSSYYNVSRSINTAHEAVLMLGFVTVRTLVISSGLVNGFRAAPGLDLNQFWRYSLNTAVAARWLAQEADENTDLAFTIGLVHAIGQLVIHAGLPDEAQALDKTVGILWEGRAEAERRAFGFDHIEVGAELTRRWKFPPSFADALQAFEKPLERAPLNRLAGIVHVASWQAKSNEYMPKDTQAPYPAAVATSLGLAPFVTLEDMPPLAELSDGLEIFIA